MIKKYQVFISSTFEDLKEERRGVIEALLGADYIPVGMEWFGARSEPSWDVIKRTIDTSDLYILIIGFRYGTESDNGISYTEEEYNYAVAQKIPILAFIRDEKSQVSKDKWDDDQKKVKKLEAFKKRVQKIQCAYWENDNELTINVLQSLNNPRLDKTNLPGWHRFEPVVTSTAVGNNAHYLFISALQSVTTDSMRSSARNQEDLAFRNDLSRNEAVHCWDIAKDCSSDQQRLTDVKEHSLPVIMKYFNNKIQELAGIQDITLFYAGPAGLAFHIGCLFANVQRPKIYQFSNSKYIPFGVVSKL